MDHSRPLRRGVDPGAPEGDVREAAGIGLGLARASKQDLPHQQWRDQTAGGKDQPGQNRAAQHAALRADKARKLPDERHARSLTRSAASCQ